MRPSSPTASGSAFVTVMAKVSIVVGAGATLYAALQVLAALVILRGEEVARFLDFVATQPVPASALWVLSHITALAVVFLLVSVAFLAVSVGLLRRRTWAWWGFVLFMVLGALANFAGIAVIDLVFSWLDRLPQMPDAAPLLAELASLRAMSLTMAWVTALAFGVLHALIVWQLCRPTVRAEFGWTQPPR